ncbi:MAG: response regulator transcription factor [Verrucomicrobiae bacterium]|nr:response regulator transcription factor [Verrucomicrobiae bacterium]
MKVLVVEDEPKIRSFIEKGLKAEGFVVECLENGEDAYRQMQIQPYDAVVLDIMIHGRDGLSLLKSVRKQGINAPIILVSARGELDDRLQGLNLGADDYLAKPFHMDELVARIRALHRRANGVLQNIISVSDLSINLATREVTRAGEAIELTPREFILLETLARAPGRVYTRIQLLESVWSYDFDPNTNLVDVYIKRVRKKIDTTGQPLIETVRGVGYRMLNPE